MTPSVLEVKDLCKTFRDGPRVVDAADHVSLEVRRGEILGLVGESGSGKSTVARLITHIEKPDSGTILVDGEDYSSPSRRKQRELHRKIQMVFQNPERSFQPRMRIGASLQESLHNFHPELTETQTRKQIGELMGSVGLDPSLRQRYPKDLSGGQCQRAAIVRALTADPCLLICDEATSALDVLIQAKIVELLMDLRDKRDLSILFISHDLALVSSICDRIAIMQKGRIVETGPTETILHDPKEPYTQNLMRCTL